MRKSFFLLILFLITQVFVFGYKVRFIVEVPSYTPESDTLYIAGSFNGWNPGDPKFTFTKTDYYKYELVVELSGRIEYKITRGSWETVEKGVRGVEIPNRVLTVDKDITVEIQIPHWRDFVENKSAGIKNTYTGNIKAIKDFYSPELNNKRDVIIYLPPDYESSDNRYPVLYMHDGQNLFNASTSFIGVEWNADESAQELILKGEIEPIIIVGIYNNSDRLNEFSPWKDGSYGGGKGDLYVDFIVKTLKPFIDKEFRTLPDRENTAIAGSSMGGLISLYAGIKYQDVFSKIGVMSPSVFFANKELLRFSNESGIKSSLKIYLDMGTAEGSNPQIHLDNFRELVNVLKEKDTLSLKVIEDKGAVHNESAWAKRFPELLKFFFGK